MKKTILSILLLGLFLILSGYSAEADSNYNIDIYLDLDEEGDKYLGTITNLNGATDANIYILKRMEKVITTLFVTYKFIL